MNGPDVPERVTLTVPEAAAIAGVSRNLMYELVATGQVPCALRLGRRIVIPRAAFHEWLESAGSDRSPSCSESQ